MFLFRLLNYVCLSTSRQYSLSVKIMATVFSKTELGLSDWTFLLVILALGGYKDKSGSIYIRRCSLYCFDGHLLIYSKTLSGGKFIFSIVVKAYENFLVFPLYTQLAF